jgi:hypothetical protein
MINLDTIPIPVPSVASRIMDGEAVLVHPGRGKVKVLNEIGAEIWKRLDGESPIRKIVDDLLLLYSVERIVLEQDVFRFIEGLKERDLISTGDSSNAS